MLVGSSSTPNRLAFTVISPHHVEHLGPVHAFRVSWQLLQGLLVGHCGLVLVLSLIKAVFRRSPPTVLTLLVAMSPVVDPVLPSRGTAVVTIIYEAFSYRLTHSLYPLHFACASQEASTSKPRSAARYRPS